MLAFLQHVLYFFLSLSVHVSVPIHTHTHTIQHHLKALYSHYHLMDNLIFHCQRAFSTWFVSFQSRWQDPRPDDSESNFEATSGQTGWVEYVKRGIWTNGHRDRKVRLFSLSLLCIIFLFCCSLNMTFVSLSRLLIILLFGTWCCWRQWPQKLSNKNFELKAKINK